MPVVSNTVQLPDGSGAQYATVVIRLIANATVGTEAPGYVGTTEILGTFVPAVTSAGVWSLTLAANATIVPSGTVYQITTQIPGRPSVVEYVSVPNGAGPYTVSNILTSAPSSITPTELAAHLADTVDAHDASAVSMTAVAGLSTTDTVQAALGYLSNVYNVKAYGAVGDGVADDTTEIQAALTAGAGKRVYVPDGTWLISAPLVISSNTRLELHPAATIKLAAGSNCNMLNNTAVTAARSVIDGAITGGAATLTSATAAFVAGDVGKTVTIVGAATVPTLRFTSTISSVTNSTTAVLAANATSTVTNAWVTIGTRDTNIHVTGGTWDRVANGAGSVAGWNGNSLRLRRLDLSSVTDTHVTGTAGKYGVSWGDAWRFSTSRITNSGFSDGVHVNGPARHGVIRDTYSQGGGDDTVSLTCADFTTFPNAQSSMMDVWGDISNVVVNGVQSDYGGQRGVYVAAGTVSARAMAVRDITIRDVQGHFRSDAVSIGGDTQDASLQGGTYTSILVDGVKHFGGVANVANGTVTFKDGTHDDITLRNLSADPTNDTAAVYVAPTTLTCTMNRLLVDGVTFLGGVSPNAVVNVGRGTVAHLILSNARCITTSTGVSLVRLISSLSPASGVTRLQIANCYLENASGGNTSAIVAAQDSGSTLTVVSLSNIATKNVTYPLGRYATTTRLKATNIRMESAASQIRMEATGAVTIEAQNLDSNTYGPSFAAGGTLRSLSLGFQTDISTSGFASTTNDLVTNSNAALSCGAGPVGYTGAAWKHLISGLTYP